MIHKYLAVFIFFCGYITKVSAQDYYNPESVSELPERIVYLGVASGLENYTGLIGLSLETNVSRSFALYAGAGLGSWGYKISGGIKYYNEFPLRWAYCLSLSHATGLKNFETQMGTRAGTQNVRMDLLSCQTLNFSAQHHWRIGTRSRFDIEFGYAVPLTYDAYTVKDGAVLTEESELAMKILQPGGLILGVAFSFGL